MCDLGSLQASFRAMRIVLDVREPLSFHKSERESQSQ